MNTYAKLIIIILIVALAVCAAIFTMLRINRDKTIPESPETVSEEPTAYVENLLELSGLLGKAPEDTGFKEADFTESSGFTVLKADGRLFEKNAYALVYFSGDYGSSEKYANSVYIQCSEMSFDECRERLISLYGEPTGEGELPYAVVNGGALSFCYFESGDLKIELSKGSERDYFDINFKMKRD